MCRLFGIISRVTCDASYWFFESSTPFKAFSERVINRGPHNSGWGVAWLKDKWNIFKEGKNDVKSYDFEKLRELKSKIMLIHLRHASVGEETTRNAHPFSYKNYVFAHNGGVNRDKVKGYLNDKFKKQIKTDTDSEVYFLLIMQFLEETKDIIKAIGKTLKIARKFPYRSLNFIMSDGKKLFTFRDVSLEHKDKIDYYCLHYLKQKDQVIISSDPLSKDGWISVNLGELIIIDKDLKITKKVFIV